MEAGRSCPLQYRYSPEALNRPPAFTADTIYVVGGLYGNVEALASIEQLAVRERGRLVFNGDFNWFNIDPSDFVRINDTVLHHCATKGNVEAEIGCPSGAGCGCAYPDTVDDQTILRSNRIMSTLQRTGAAAPCIVRRLEALPMHLVVNVDGCRVGIVHGDLHSLSGWGFDESELAEPLDLTSEAVIVDNLRHANVDVVACSHTCLPCARDFNVDGRRCAVINNGSAGMPNFRGDQRGVVTRISTMPPPIASLYGMRINGAYVDAIPIDYDFQAWRERFVAQWPVQSPAHASYFHRICEGPFYERHEAARGAFRVH